MCSLRATLLENLFLQTSHPNNFTPIDEYQRKKKTGTCNSDSHNISDVMMILSSEQIRTGYKSSKSIIAIWFSVPEKIMNLKSFRYIYSVKIFCSKFISEGRSCTEELKVSVPTCHCL